MNKKVLILPGDGIGPEIVGQAKAVLSLVNEKHKLQLELDEALIGGAAIDATGQPLPEETINKAKESPLFCWVLSAAQSGNHWICPSGLKKAYSAYVPAWIFSATCAQRFFIRN